MLMRVILLSLCLAASVSQQALATEAQPVTPRAITLFDAKRQRPVPVLIYGETAQMGEKPLAVISHGYGGRNDAYAFLAADLVSRGYLVASIQHLERPGDPPMATTGDIATLRRPIWQIGADSIGFVIDEMTHQGFGDASAGVVLVGHSNGGDMSMLFATQYPDKVRIALSLDSRRMPLPRTKAPRICSLRSNDQAADPGVLPSPEEQAALQILIVEVPVKHNDMWDGATPDQKAEMLKAVDGCLGG